MAVVVAPRRPGCKPSLSASLPASLFGKFQPNGGGATSKPVEKEEVPKRKPGFAKREPAKAETKPRKRETRADKSQLAVPKQPPAKPGKRAPTKKEREWMDAIVRFGCVACRIEGLGVRPAAVHHILRNGQRIGHLFTIPLCDPGHHQGGKAQGMVSRHPDKAAFERKYGSEQHLLERVRAELKGAT